MRELLIVGAGGLGREVLGYIEDDNPLFRFKGFLDDRADALVATPREPGIVGSPDAYIPSHGEVFMAAIGDPKSRERYTRRLRDIHQADFATVVHPLANVSRRAAIGRGCIVGPRVGISVDVQIGDFSCIQEYAVIGHDVRIGSWCQINSHCTIAGGASIGNFVTIGPNCVISRQTILEDGVTVAAGSVVYGRIKAGLTVMGNPARLFQFKNDSCS